MPRESGLYVPVHLTAISSTSILRQHVELHYVPEIWIDCVEAEPDQGVAGERKLEVHVFPVALNADSLCGQLDLAHVLVQESLW